MKKTSAIILGLFCLQFMVTTVSAETVVCPTPGDVVDPKTNICLQKAITKPQCSTGYYWMNSTGSCGSCPAHYHYDHMSGKCVHDSQ